MIHSRTTDVRGLDVNFQFFLYYGLAIELPEVLRSLNFDFSLTW
jgi:hypothetical protein